MKLEFSSLEEVRKFAEQVFFPPQVTFAALPPAPGEIVGAGAVIAAQEAQQQQQSAVGTVEAEKPKRKPRADAGVPRGPYKTTGEPATAAAQGQEPQRTEPPAPVSPTQQAAPPASAATPPAAPVAPSPAGAAPTLADARAALKRISDTKGLGAEAVVAHLAAHGVNQLTKLPEAMYAAFIAAADAKVKAVAK